MKSLKTLLASSYQKEFRFTLIKLFSMKIDKLNNLDKIDKMGNQPVESTG